ISYNVTGLNDFDPAAYNLPTTYTYGVGATLSGITLEGRTFNGWYSDAALSASITAIAANRIGDVTVYGSVTNNTYAITYSVTGVNGFDAAAYNLPTEYTYGTAVTLTAPAITGHNFAGWYTDAGLTAAITEIAANRTGDVTLYGQATAATYAITYDVTGLANFDPAAYNLPTTYTYGTGATLTVPTHNGYDFNCWYSDAALSAALTAVSATQTGDLTIYGEATAKTFQITFYQTNYEFGSASWNTILAGSPTITVWGVTLDTTYTYSETDITLPTLTHFEAPTNGAGSYTQGYYDDQGNSMNDTIPAGTYGDIEIYIHAYEVQDTTTLYMNAGGNYATSMTFDQTTGAVTCEDATSQTGIQYFIDSTAVPAFYYVGTSVHVYSLWDDNNLVGLFSNRGLTTNLGFAAVQQNNINFAGYGGFEVNVPATDNAGGSPGMYFILVYDPNAQIPIPQVAITASPFDTL
ncbi:MAG: InlB B-repeat-containing protein, partial [Lachnospiraceae bacterium]|nr:InlB B-repeat-containing protein [Lachnospiraceae bacterium]